MEAKISQALTRFEYVCDNWNSAQGQMEKFAPYAYVWRPTRISVTQPKQIGLTLQAITHGNEVGGLATLFETLLLLKNGLLQPPFALGFVLGNPEAALANRRFLERDLNRSFGQSSQLTGEERRAGLLEPLLGQSSFFVDYHQTIEPTRQPFFIFPYTQAAMAMAAQLHSEIPIVTHWGPSFSKDGMCSDEYVNHRGGTGLSIELGQKGFDSYHTAIGLQVALAAIQYAIDSARSAALQESPLARDKLYTWRAVVPYEAGMQLNEGLHNFQELKAGDELGRHQGKVLRAVADGCLLFPKYSRDPQAAPPKELYRIIKRIRVDELGQDGVINR